MQESSIKNRRRSQSSQTIRETFTFVDYDYLIKIVIVGDSGVGKSQLVGRFTRNEFSVNCRQTIGVEFATKTINIKGKAICAQIWDTAGEERYRALASAYYRGAVGVVLVYDVANMRSFESILHWLSEVRTYTVPSCQIILVGNKTDLNRSRKVDEGSGKTFASDNDMQYIEASALDNTNVEEAFTALMKEIYAKTLLPKTDENEARLFSRKTLLSTTKNGDSNKSTGCCS